MRVHMCTREALAVQWDCILALASCSFLYAKSSSVCWQAHWQLHAVGKGTCLNCTGGLSSAKQPYSRWKMLEQVACVYESFYFEIDPAHKVLAHASWICKNKIGTVGQSDCGHKDWSLQPCICFYTPFIDFINSTVSHDRYSRISPRLLCFNGMPQHCCCSLR